MADTGEKNYIAKESTLQNVESTMAKETTLQGVDTDVDSLVSTVSSLVSTVNAMKTAMDTLAASGGGNANAGVPVSAQLVNTESAGTSATAVSVSGKGFTDVIVYAGNANNANIVRVIVDGVTVVNNAQITDFPTVMYNGSRTLFCYNVQVRFNKSISIWIDSPSAAMWTHAKGIVYFEE